MALDPDLVAILALVGAVTSVLALLVTLAVLAAMRRSRPLDPAAAPTAPSTAPVAPTAQPSRDARALRHVAVVRYDAFGDLAGRLSFSLALLDDGGDGIVLTSISGRSESRTYAKGIVGGRGEQQLSPEEEQAVAAARRGVPAQARA